MIGIDRGGNLSIPSTPADGHQPFVGDVEDGFAFTTNELLLYNSSQAANKSLSDNEPLLLLISSLCASGSAFTPGGGSRLRL